MDREDAAHRHEAEAEEEDPVLGDLYGRDRQQHRQPEGQERHCGDDQEVLARHDQAGVGSGMRRQPPEDAGGEEERADRRRWRGFPGPGLRDGRGGSHNGITDRWRKPLAVSFGYG